MLSKNAPSTDGPFADRICRAVIVLEHSKETFYNVDTNSSTSETLKKRKPVSLERELQALNELSWLLNSWESLGRVPRHVLTGAVSALFQCLDHREQSLRFIADQTLDAVFRKFLLKFQPEKVVAFLLNELSKRTNPARAVCAALQKLSWTIGKPKAQRASIFLTHLLNASAICLQRPEESVHAAIERHFPVIFAQIGTVLVGINNAEKAEELFEIAMENLKLNGTKNRAASTTIAQLAKFVPSILHKSFYNLSKIVFELDEKEHKMRLVGALNTFRMVWPHLVEHLTEGTLPNLQKLLSKVLCCLCCEANEVLVAALELLRECAQHFVQQWPPPLSSAFFNFNPGTIILSDPKNPSDLATSNFPFHASNDGQNSRGKSGGEEAVERLTLRDDAESVFSMGTSKMSAWSSMGDLGGVGEMDISPQAEFGMEDLNTALSRIGINLEERGQINETLREVKGSADDNEEDDKFSVISAELFTNRKSERTESDESDQSGAEGPDQLHETSGSRGRQGWDCGTVPFDSDDLSFWLHCALTVARRFLLAGHGQLYDDSKVRISHKILAMEVLGCAAVVEPKLASANCFIVHDDNLAVAALKLAFTVGKWKLWKLVGEQKLVSQQRHGTEERGRLAWHLKKTLHINRSPNRLKSVLQLFSHSIALFGCPFDDGQLLGVACEYAISSKHCDYFLVKTSRVEFLSKIRWSRTLTKCRVRLQGVCLRLFIRHLFDSDIRVQNAARNALPKLILNAQIGDRGDTATTSNVARHLSSPIRFQSPKLIHRTFSLVPTFPSANLDFGNGSRPLISYGQDGVLPNGHKLLFLLLECAESGCASLNELNSLLKLIAALFAGIFEGHLLHSFEFGGRGTNIHGLFWGIGPNPPPDEAHLKQQHPLALGNVLQERMALLLLRVLNLFYAVVAEERTLRTEKSASMANSSAEGAFAAVLSRPSLFGHSTEKMSLISGGGDEFGVGPVATHPSKAVNFSLLIGSGIKASRPTSFTHSATLNSLEPTLKAAYKSFIEQLNPESFGRFLEPLESAICGLCALLEVANLAFVRTFLDELLLYQRMLIDISPANSARLIHQLLKCVFSTNAQNLNGKAARQSEIWEQHIMQTNDPLERHLFGPLNNFTVFTAFVRRTEFADAFVARLSGWMLPNRLGQHPAENAQLIGELLHKFEPFITHLLKLYPMSNSVHTKRAVLDCVCSLCLCNVSYQLLDRNGKFQSRVLAQLKQLSPVDDVPLLPNILAFFCVLARIHFTKFSEIENLMADLFSRMDDKNCAFILEAMKIVLLDVYFNVERKGKHPDEHLRCLTRLKAILVKEFPRTFGMAPAESAQCWLILMSDIRQQQQWEEGWSDASLELFSLFVDFGSCHCSILSPLPSPSRRRHSSPANGTGLWPMSAPNLAALGEEGAADWTRQMFLYTFLLSVCSPVVFRPVDEFFHSVQSFLDKFAFPPPNGQFPLQIAFKFGPFLFVLLNQIEEEIFLLRIGTIFREGNLEIGEEQRVEKALDYIGRNIASILIENVCCLYSESNAILPKLEGLNAKSDFEERTALFTIFTLHQCIRAGKAPRLIEAIRKHLGLRVNDINICLLASVSPALFLFWTSLLLLLDLGLNFSPAVLLSLPSHCQSFLIHLAVHTLCEDELPKITANNNLQMVFMNFSSEFCVRLLMLEEEKTFRKLLSRLSQKAIRHIIEQMEAIIASNAPQIDTILPRFCMLMAKSEDPSHLERASRMMEVEQSHWKELLLDDTKPSPCRNKLMKFGTKSLSQLSSNSLSTQQFYRIIATHFSEELWHQICLGLFILDKNAILDIFGMIGIEWPIRRRFFQNLFTILANMQNEGNRQPIVDALIEFELLNRPNGQPPSAEEMAFIFSRLAELFQRLPLNPMFLPRDKVEKTLNCLFVRMLWQRILENRKMPSDYFKAMKLFFSLQSQFLTILWEHLEKDIPRWNRLLIDRQHWAVNVRNSDVRGDELGEQLLKLFSAVQRIVFAAKNGLLGGDEAEEAFRALLGVSLLQRMALVPESALRLDWSLVIEANRSDDPNRIFVPLIQIHMLNDPEVLSDFSWRALWLGWESRAQFEDLWMSLFGVLSSTPTSSREIHQRASAESLTAVQQQLTLLFPNPGSPIDSDFVSEYGLLAANAKMLTDQMLGEKMRADPSESYIQNLEKLPAKGYDMGQTSLVHLRSLCGFNERIIEEETQLRTSSSAHLIAQSTELDTTSSLRALFDTFAHWLNSSDLALIPMAILSGTLRSLTLLSDLFHDPSFYQQTFSTLWPLMGTQKALLEDHSARGNVILLLLKCASVLEWSELPDSGETGLPKFFDFLLETGIRRAQCQFERECSLNGLLYLLQSDHLHRIQPSTMQNVIEFLVNELQRMQRRTDILSDFQPDSMEYNKLAWAVMFFIVEDEPFPIDARMKNLFLHIVSDSFVDPRIPNWQKEALTHGIESLVLRNCSYAPTFRKMSLECFATYQLQPSHLPFALSIYLTCIYRELQEGGEFAYGVNKSFPADDFHKFLNVFSFYAASSSSTGLGGAHCIVRLASDLICSVWSKECILECVWSLLIPPSPMTSPKSLKNPLNSFKIDPSEGEATNHRPNSSVNPLEHPLQCSAENQNIQNFGSSKEGKDCAFLRLTQLDQSLIHLLHVVFKTLFLEQRRVCLELAVNFLLPKVTSLENESMAKCLSLMLLCSANGNRDVWQRIHFLLHSEDPIGSDFFGLAFPEAYIQMLIHSFIGECEAVNLNIIKFVPNPIAVIIT
uniref:Huntingtin n=1 Tax=Globodera rostochiensis TaxID=31243 RepID=A0A914H263_GLORO